jgi:hypothetical protein
LIMDVVCGDERSADRLTKQKIENMFLHFHIMKIFLKNQLRKRSYNTQREKCVVVKLSVRHIILVHVPCTHVHVCMCTCVYVCVHTYMYDVKII